MSLDGLLHTEREAWRALIAAARNAALSLGAATAQQLARQAQVCRKVPMPLRAGSSERDPGIISSFRALIAEGARWPLRSREVRGEAADNLTAIALACESCLDPEALPAPEPPPISSTYVREPPPPRKDIFE